MIEDEESLQYIDYTVHERNIDMTSSHEFWYLQFEGYNLEHRLSLPVDQHYTSNDQRSGFASTAQISFDRQISTSFLDYASIHDVTPFQLGLAIFYSFLFKLTHDQNDLCVTCLNANRYRTELQNMMGMFVSTLPYRIQLNTHWSFNELVKHVREKCLSILEHSHYPLQNILTDLHLNQSTVPFLQISFDLMTIFSSINQFSFDDVSLKPVLLEKLFEAAKFDFLLRFVYNSTSDDNILSCHLICSRDLFEDTTIAKIGQRFQYFFEQLFSMDFDVNQTDLIISPVTKLSLILPDELAQGRTPASFAQARIWLDERIRFDPEKPQVAIYNMPFVYRLSSTHTLSIKQLYNALQLILTKHESLRTSLVFNTETNSFMQQIMTSNNDNNTLFTFIQSTYETHQQLTNIIHEEKRNPQLFHLAQGLVFRCHLIYYKHISSNDLLSDKDVIIFNFHHATFDVPSMNVFLHDLNQAYTTSQLSNTDDTIPRYVDYAVIERQMPMSGANLFWHDTLYDCKLDQSLSLPYDRYRLVNEHRTGRGTFISFDFGQDISRHLLSYASAHNHSIEHLSLAIYYIFLFKLTNRENDLCIGMNTHGRYRDELKSVIGMFVNAIPLRCQLDSHWSFCQLLDYVSEMIRNSMKYSYFPLQRILDQHPNILHPAFLDISFEFISYNNNNEIRIGDSPLSLVPLSLKISEDEIMSKFDFIVIGIMAIEMIGSVYCPLSARDPQHRLYSLIEQTQSRLVLVHSLTKEKFNDNIILVNMDSILTNNDMENNVDIDELSSIRVTSHNIAYIIFTSGSTGIPKA
ncbi:hypothetical protein I4U23_017076, partial [Adineta vaga]